MFFISKKWRHPKVIMYLMYFEFAPIVAILALTGIASPNLYREKLWQFGGEQGFNSEPLTIVYSYANYKPLKTPLVWSSLNTQFALVISVLSMFLLLTKLTMHITSTWYPIIAFVINSILTGLWAAGIYIQTSSDTIDPEHQSNGAPWYIMKSCNIVPDGRLKGYCNQAKSTFAVSVIMLAIVFTHLVLTIWSMVPTKDQKERRQAKRDEKANGSPMDELTAEEAWRRQWEAGEVPPTPGIPEAMRSPGFAPMTPRTKAFNNLGGGGGYR